MKNKFIRKSLLTLAITTCFFSCVTKNNEDTNFNAIPSLDYCVSQTSRTLEQIQNKDGIVDYTLTPRNIAPDDSIWQLRKAAKEEWCGGFWPGILWYAYEHSGDSTILNEAELYTEELGFLSHTPAFDHDLGFLIFCSYGNGYRLTGNDKYKRIILDTADTLATLFNPTVGTILSWPRHVKDYGGHNTIMDNMMNLEMLFWAAKNGGNKSLYDIAVRHAEKTMENHFREDGGCYHVAVYDTISGDFIRGCTHQGYADNSLWARGQAWAIYGYTMVYRETGEERFLEFANKVTDLYLSRLPEDYVPYWDFDAPTVPDAPRDASAAAVVASALIELSEYVPEEKSKKYMNAAEKMLTSLSSEKYRSGEAKPSFLLHSTGHHPAGSEIDYSIIYADYYYIEALTRWKKAHTVPSIRVYDYPTKDGIEEMNDYEVYVKAAADNELWHKLKTLRCDVDMHKVQKASFAEFDMAKPIIVRVRNIREDAIKDGKMDFIVRPLSKNIKAQYIDERTIEFKMDTPEYLSVEFNKDRKHNLHIFANNPETETYTGRESNCINWVGKNNHDVFVKDASLIYFGPGVHKPKDLPSAEIKIPSNTTVYIAPGAIVKAKLCVDHAENVRIIGRGILDHPLRGVEITFSKNVLVDGITMVNPQHYTVFGGQSENITIRNIKSFSRHGWSDGIDLMCCKNVVIDNIFLRNSDDCIALYNHRWWYWGGTQNVKISQATLWADVAHPFNFGCHGDDRSKSGEIMRDIYVSDCDILNEDDDGVFSIRSGDKNTLENITFDNIRVEDIERGCLFNVQIIFSDKYNRAPGKSIKDLTFRNISFTGDESTLSRSVIKDYDENNTVRDVRFEKITINGRKFNPSTEIDWTILENK